MKALILAAGFGIRLKGAIGDRPKVMATIKGRPFLEYAIFYLKGKSIKEYVFAVSYLAEQIIDHFGDGRKFGIKIDYSFEEEPMGTGGTLKNAEEKLKKEKNFFVLNGDTYFEINLDKFLSFHQTHSGCASMACKPLGYGQTTQVKTDSKTGQVRSLSETPVGKAKGLINAGAYIFNPGIFSFIKPNKKVSLEQEVFPRLVKKGELYGWEASGFYIEIGTRERYNRARRLLPPLPK